MNGNSGGLPILLYHDDIVRRLKAAVEREGGQSAFARRHRVDRSRLNRMLSGKLLVNDRVAKALGQKSVHRMMRGHFRRRTSRVERLICPTGAASQASHRLALISEQNCGAVRLVCLQMRNLTGGRV